MRLKQFRDLRTWAVLINKNGTSLYITNTKLSLGRNGLFPTTKQQTQHSAEFNKLRISSTWVSEMEDLKDVIIWVTNHSLKKSKTL